MTAPEQQTIGGEATLEGVGLHTGSTARLTFLPAEANAGIRFRRVDLDGRPELQARLQHVASTDRGTTLAQGDVRVHTIEHVLAAVSALGIDNIIIEIDGPEIPILDGSFQPFFEALETAGLNAQGVPPHVIRLNAPVSIGERGSPSYSALPAEHLRISTTIEFDHPLIRRQFGSWDVSPDAFRAELSAARTFGFMNEAEALRARGLAQGVTLDNAVVLNDEGLEQGELRWDDEFVRHKVGDIIGDLALLGGRLHAHVIADRPSHAGNLELARAIAESVRRSPAVQGIVDINRIMQHLPHRYPMLLVDRIIEYESERRIVGIKNVTINEPFFQGHYPGHPVMPGVLIIEAMAQVGGLLMMGSIPDVEEKIVYFMSLDNVKWRRPITPGDQIRFEVEVLSMRRHVCKMRGEGFVDGKLAVEAEMMARIVDR
ncbi:MAG TPA: UDP-3-O-acyl-N-acetylglucosamine deacetylase [Longimicrobiales bacterium]|nr:UDP-3-O-acyl-N-acetylglucosamine deacetylase [Longimicrobiales bacterium]